MSKQKFDVAIIGAGIAGMTAAIYARRAGKTVVIFEEKLSGGQALTTYDIQNWPGEKSISGKDLMDKIYHQANNLGAIFCFEKVKEIENIGEEKRITTEESEYTTDAIIIATGSTDRAMDAEGEAEFAGRGVSYCATCDGALYADKTVAVIGGGNSALYNTMYLAGIAKKVYLVHRRDTFRADQILVDKVSKFQNVEFVMNAKPQKVLGSEKVEGLEIAQISPKTDQNSDTAESSNSNQSEASLTLAVDGIFVSVGKKPATDLFKNLVDLDESGYIIAGEDCKTSAPNIFAAGDCRTKNVRQLITAAADGAIAASSL